MKYTTDPSADTGAQDYMNDQPSIDTKDQPTCLCIDPIFWNEPCPAHPDKSTPTALSSIDEIRDILRQFRHDDHKVNLGLHTKKDADELLENFAQHLEAHIAEHYVPKAEVTKAKLDNAKALKNYMVGGSATFVDWVNYLTDEIHRLEATLNTKGEK